MVNIDRPESPPPNATVNLISSQTTTIVSLAETAIKELDSNSHVLIPSSTNIYRYHA